MNGMVQYCFNKLTKEIVEGSIPPSLDFIPIIGYFPKGSADHPDFLKEIEEIAEHQESGFDVDNYSEEEDEDEDHHSKEQEKDDSENSPSPIAPTENPLR